MLVPFNLILQYIIYMYFVLGVSPTDHFATCSFNCGIRYVLRYAFFPETRRVA